MTKQKRCGYVALVGRPNVGKSTLMNTLVGKKVSITCHKRQTTRHVIRGIKTSDTMQAIYVDMPGIHSGSKRALNRYMNRVASGSLTDVDVALFLVSAEHWTDEDDLVLDQLRKVRCPVILVVNKIDQISERDKLLALLQSLSAKFDFAAVVPISARQRDNVDELEKLVTSYLPEGEFLYSEDQVTDSQKSFFIAEVIREKLFKQAHQEIPYSATVLIDKMEREGRLTKIYATIFVEKASQKAIVIGKQGSKLKQIGQQARLELERHYGGKIYLQLWVKVKEEWADNERQLRNLGFD